MKLIRILCAVSLLGAVTACQTERTVLAGPTVTGLEAQGSSGESRFSNQDPFGYQQNKSEGLNAMSEKMFGGKLQAQSQKEFTKSKDFLTREYGGKKDFAAKSWKGDPKGRTWTDKLFDTDDRPEGEVLYRDGGREAAVKDNADATKMANTKDFTGADRTARTSNYRPAEKALEDGRDAPRLGDARPERLSSQERAIRDRISNSNASAVDINKLLGKP